MLNASLRSMLNLGHASLVVLCRMCSRWLLAVGVLGCCRCRWRLWPSSGTLRWWLTRCWSSSLAVSPVAWTPLASTCHATLPHVVLFVALASDAALSVLVLRLGFIMLSSSWISSSWSPSSCSCFALSQWGRCLRRSWSSWV